MPAPKCVLSLGGAVSRCSPCSGGPWGAEGAIYRPLLLLPALVLLSTALRPSGMTVRRLHPFRFFQCCTIKVFVNSLLTLFNIICLMTEALLLHFVPEAMASLACPPPATGPAQYQKTGL